MRLSSLLLIASLYSSLSAQQSLTETFYLSGTGFDHTKKWEFYCTAGMNSGRWTTIQVPSCWEQQGFGEYNYGHVPFSERLKEEGQYRYTFTAGRHWKDRHVDLVFEGVMTDCRVLLNGIPAGEVHQGAFYRFNYDVSKLLKYGKENTLEVFVKKFSENESVNQAERKADYWIFGGIFRPVYLEVKPREHIRRVAVDARADGTFRAEVYMEGLQKARSLKAVILDSKGTVAAEFISVISLMDGKSFIGGTVQQPHLWNPEYPNLYRVVFSLVDGQGVAIHRLEEKVGFRTVEIREQDGIYVNGVRIRFRGVNRHSFHPDHGRTSSPSFSVEVVNLIKDMNMNAVRMSHYPPDEHFLDACDSLGLFVLDELAGWQQPPYDPVIGRKLLAEMIARDVNHPCVVMWDNGNEGGWNTAYDGDFKKLDIQQREVNHPWAVFGKTNTAHYVEYDYLSLDHFAPRKIFFPTELLHGLYDGGHGAGLEDFWLRVSDNPLAAGAFLWVFADEAVRRTDTGELDPDGNHAPDGILGPYHEKEGSYYTIREIWAPVQFEKRYITPGFNGVFRIRNRFHYSRLEDCSFSYRWIDLPGPGQSGAVSMDAPPCGTILHEGIPEADPLGPDQAGILRIPLPEEWIECELLEIEAMDPHGRLIHRWTWPVKSPAAITTRMIESEMTERPDDGMLGKEVQGTVRVSETSGRLVLTAGGVEIAISGNSGMLESVTSGGKKIPLSGGPIFLSEPLTVTELRHGDVDGSHRATADYGNGNWLEWVMHPGGLLEMELRYRPDAGVAAFTGASFQYPEKEISSVRLMGNGPYRVWKNRLKGVNFNIWEKPYNNTITGHSGYLYPEFKGYYSNLYWARFESRDTPPFTVFSRTEDLFLRLFTPEEAPDPARTTVEHPPGDLSFMRGIPAIGTKFKDPELLGPQSRPYRFMDRRVEDGTLTISLLFDFREE